MASEMEGAAIAQACHAFGVPFIVIRAISDIPERGTSAVDFDTFIVQAGKTFSANGAPTIARMGSVAKGVPV